MKRNFTFEDAEFDFEFIFEYSNNVLELLV